jgi:hypothetical protein
MTQESNLDADENSFTRPTPIRTFNDKETDCSP